MPSDQPALARPATVAALVGFPVALAAADLVAPSFAHGGALAAAIAAHPTRTWLFVGLRLADAALLLAAAGVVWLLARQSARGRVAAGFAAALALLGALGQAQDGAYQLFVLSLRDHSADQAGAILTRLDTLAAPLELPLLLAFALALPLLPVAAFAAHFAPGPIPSHVADLLLIGAFVGAAIAPKSRPASTGQAVAISQQPTATTTT